MESFRLKFWTKVPETKKMEIIKSKKLLIQKHKKIDKKEIKERAILTEMKT